MKIKRVAQYQTSDGLTFAEKKDAQAHQKKLDRIESLIALIDDKASVYGTLSSPGEHTRENLLEITYGELAYFIANNADAIRELLPQRAAKTIADEPTLPGSGEVDQSSQEGAGIQVEELAEA
jgi:dsDNA-binding SOS-regulon protein